MMKLMSLEFPLGKEVLTTVRLVTGGVCALVGLGLDEAEDCKVCVTESLLLLLGGGGKNAKVTFERGKNLSVLLEAEYSGEKSGAPVEEEISVALLRAFVEDLEIVREKEHARISFGFGAL